MSCLSALLFQLCLHFCLYQYLSVQILCITLKRAKSSQPSVNLLKNCFIFKSNDSYSHYLQLIYNNEMLLFSYAPTMSLTTLSYFYYCSFYSVGNDAVGTDIKCGDQSISLAQS